MSFDNFLSQLKTKANELKTEALKFKNKDFLNAAMAGSALAEGEMPGLLDHRQVGGVVNGELDGVTVRQGNDVDASVASRSQHPAARCQ